ncbi:hypothetical protein L209DRAFT_577113 [Thermothelomyces heterothallicus CBS 203.75]
MGGSLAGSSWSVEAVAMKLPSTNHHLRSTERAIGPSVTAECPRPVDYQPSASVAPLSETILPVSLSSALAAAAQDEAHRERDASMVLVALLSRYLQSLFYPSLASFSGVTIPNSSAARRIPKTARRLQRPSSQPSSSTLDSSSSAASRACCTYARTGGARSHYNGNI